MTKAFTNTTTQAKGKITHNPPPPAPPSTATNRFFYSAIGANSFSI